MNDLNPLPDQAFQAALKTVVEWDRSLPAMADWDLCKLQVALNVAAPIIVAAELRRLANEWKTWISANGLRERADELDPL